MAKDTRQKILLAALKLFSSKGYDGTNIRELTASLGLVKSSMYRHFTSKEEIWNAMLDRMIAYYAARSDRRKTCRPHRIHWKDWSK